MSISPAQLKEARRLLGWTLSMVGGKSDLSTSTISFFETGRRRPSALVVCPKSARSLKPPALSSSLGTAKGRACA
jgi:transcriptional regulator with XRE-family HTH domain